MYTIFLIKNKTTDHETGEQIYICGPAGHEHILSLANITHYCTTPSGDLIRYETYNEEIAAKLMLDAGFVADSESGVSADLMEQSKYYTWEGTATESVSGNYDDWIEAGRPDTISTMGPAQIFGPGEAEHMTIDEAKNILDEEECK